MAVNDFLGSVAQQNISFTEVNTITSISGQNYYTPMIFINDTDAATNITTPPGTNKSIIVTAANYSSQIVASSTLFNWLANFFKTNAITQIYIVEWDSAPAALAGLVTAFNTWHALGYFKFSFETGSSSATSIKLGQLCNADTLLSQFWQGTSDTGVLVTPMTTGIGKDFISATPIVEAVGVYSAQTGINPALSALGVALQSINSTGTPVGNKLAFNGTTNVLASGTTGGTDDTNLTAAIQTVVAGNYWNFFQTVGDGTGQVVLNNSITTTNNISDVSWIESYVNYVCQVQTAQYLAQPGAPTFKSNQTYQNILAIMTGQLNLFVNINRLSNLQITKTPFSALPVTAGNTITIPNAWSATLNRTTTNASVQGNVTIQA